MSNWPEFIIDQIGEAAYYLICLCFSRAVERAMLLAEIAEAPVYVRFAGERPEYPTPSIEQVSFVVMPDGEQRFDSSPDGLYRDMPREALWQPERSTVGSP